LVTTANPPRSDASLSGRKPMPASTTPLPDAATLRAKGVSEYKASQFEQSIETFRKYLGNYPDDNQEIRWRLAQALYESGRWGEASKEFNELRGSPQPEIRADAIYKLGKVDQKKGDLTAAKQQWKRVVDSYPNTVAAKKAAESLAENP
jgi:TolA-binding protein